MEETKIENKEFKDKLAAAVVQGQTAPAPVKKGPGRPVGWRKATTETPAPKDNQSPNTIPAVNEQEALMFATMFRGVISLLIKKDYREALTPTIEELMQATRPATQLKAYYMPSLGGIYTIWANFSISAGAIVFTKVQKMKEIIENEKSIDGKINNSNIGDTGDGKINESARTIENPPAKTDI